MFVLSNAWRALTRFKGRTALTAVITLAIAFGTVAGLSIVQEDNTAHGDTYESQQATMAIRPSAATWKKVSPTDSSTTKNYMTWATYTEYATVMQTAGISLDFMVTETVPARVSGDLKALEGGSLGSASDDETGGELLWRAFWTKDSAKTNDLGTYKIVDGKALNYDTSSDVDTTGALVSKAFADANGLKVGDKFKVATASDASKTVELEVRGIYEYTSEANALNPVAAARNRENTIYTNYPAFSNAGLDPQSSDTSAKAEGWDLPDLDVVFNLTSPSVYDQVVSTLKKSKLPAKGYTISSPSLDAYNESLEPLDTLASRAKTGVIVLLVAGGALLIALVMVGVWTSKRDDEIGMALACGVTRGRLGWQFMLETFFVVVPCYAIGVVGGAFAAKPLGQALSGGHATPVTSDLVWKMVWWGLGAIIVLAILAALRTIWFGVPKMFAADGDWGATSATTIDAAEHGSATITENTDDTNAEAKA
ncbi:ABC transporter permease [Bifidobacterium oedipodis]|uniref:Permease of ABC transporter system n=1 Tax=Bifidobacterium oedipodis TaxID=2675322 RepID=A0A7Y0EN81_9BIFI|nr:ABC transporter permease [Bifidobacterium sp. DSM 109957]NMM93342.1 Permease of ABC transporter system [Bifidobacterium sp. DSM 109957]